MSGATARANCAGSARTFYSALLVNKSLHITPQEMAERLGVSVRTLGYQRQRGTGTPFVKVGRRVFYTLPDPAEEAINKARVALHRTRDALDAVRAELREVQRRVDTLRGERDFARRVLAKLEDARPQ